MNAAHKILTVSYGTFSCTLEGFEDPFNTMKAIAEYFRDLAAGDRYFGAEPPQPDAAMLHKIAEREIQARVEAKIQDNGVVLRARDQAAPPASLPASLPTAAPATVQIATPQGVEPAAHVLQEPVLHEEAPKPQSAEPALTPDPPRAAPQLLAEDAAERAMAAAAQRLSRLRAAAAANRPASPLPLAVEAPAEAPAEPIIAPPAASPLPETAFEPEYETFETAPAAFADEPPTVSPAPSRAEAPQAAPAPEAEIAADDAFLTRLTGVLDTQEAEAPQATAPQAEEQALEEAQAEAPRLLGSDTFIFTPPQATETSAEIAGATEAPEAAPQAAEEDPTDKVQRARARVIKIRRLEPAPVAAAPVAAAPVAAPITAPDSDRRQSRADRRQARAASIDTPAEAPPAPPVQAEADDAAVRRLIDKANTELEEPQTKRRRSAIAHLKAAVLATVAERRAARAPKDETLRQDPYRRDLDDAMRPAPTLVASLVPEAEKPAPLVLLPTARIETGIRPRRPSLRAVFPEDDELAAQMTNVFEDTPGKITFRDFADSLGAHDLPDLIEAAGAWLTLHRGQEHFTRPELFAQIGPLAEPSREDGLRGFGRLLREGRLSRTEDGHYTLTETSPLLAQARKRAS